MAQLTEYPGMSLRWAYQRYTVEEVERLRSLGFTFGNVPYDYDLVGPHGACFTIIDDGRTLEEIRGAYEEIKVNHDQVGVIRIAKPIEITKHTWNCLKCGAENVDLHPTTCFPMCSECSELHFWDQIKWKRLDW